MGGDPDHDRSQGLLPVLIVGRETRTLQGGILDTALLEHGDDLRSNLVPDWVERGPKHSFCSFYGEFRPSVSSVGDQEGISVDVGAVQKLRRVRRDSVIIMPPLEL